MPALVTRPVPSGSGAQCDPSTPSACSAAAAPMMSTSVSWPPEFVQVDGVRIGAVQARLGVGDRAERGDRDRATRLPARRGAASAISSAARRSVAVSVTRTWTRVADRPWS